jgi:nucleoside-diphosphate-sugar epimerase
VQPRQRGYDGDRGFHAQQRRRNGVQPVSNAAGQHRRVADCQPTAYQLGQGRPPQAPAADHKLGERISAEGIAVRDIAEVIGRHLDIPAVRVAAENATGHFGPFGMVMTLGLPPMSNTSTRQLLGWQPDHPGLIADLEQGHYLAGQ